MVDVKVLITSRNRRCRRKPECRHPDQDQHGAYPEKPRLETRSLVKVAKRSNSERRSSTCEGNFAESSEFANCSSCVAVIECALGYPGVSRRNSGIGSVSENLK